MTTYEGRPCKHGHTLRWRCNRSCIACEHKRKREKYATDEAWAERERERKREWYYNLDHMAYYGRLLRSRRRKALQRIAARGHEA